MFKVGDVVEFASEGNFDRYSKFEDPDFYDVGTVVSTDTVNGITSVDVKWFSDESVTEPSLECIRLKNTEIPTTVSNPRPHSEIIKAWADGADIEFWTATLEAWVDIKFPTWDPNIKYRIKPLVRPPIVNEIFVHPHPTLETAFNSPNLKLTFDGDTYELIGAEVIKD